MIYTGFTGYKIGRCSRVVKVISKADQEEAARRISNGKFTTLLLRQESLRMVLLVETLEFGYIGSEVIRNQSN